MKTYCFDIDGVICSNTNGQYDKAKPYWKAINLINKLYSAGHRIILFTARGTKTRLNWKHYTAKQMLKWGVKYHELRMGKPEADFYIDDRAISDIKALEH